MARNIGSIRREMQKLRKTGLKWQAIADHYGVTVGMAYRIAKNGYEPKRADIRISLGLPAMVPAPACRVCGRVHVAKSCPTKRRRRPKRLFDLSKRELLRRLREREVLKE